MQMAVGKKQVEFKKYLFQDQDGSKSLSFWMAPTAAMSSWLCQIRRRALISKPSRVC